MSYMRIVYRCVYVLWEFEVKPLEHVQKNGKSVVRTFRIPRGLNNALVREAENRGVSPNALLSMILTRFSEWDRYAEKFGYISITRDALRGILECLDDDKLCCLAEDLGSQEPRDALMFWFKEITVESFLSFLSNISKYCQVGQLEIETKSTNCVFALRHDVGAKWSKYLKCYLSRVLDGLPSVHAEYQETPKSLVVNMKFNRNDRETILQQ